MNNIIYRDITCGNNGATGLAGFDLCSAPCSWRGVTASLWNATIKKTSLPPHLRRETCFRIDLMLVAPSILSHLLHGNRFWSVTPAGENGVSTRTFMVLKSITRGLVSQFLHSSPHFEWPHLQWRFEPVVELRYDLANRVPQRLQHAVSPSKCH
jgi:hypothetical protein